MRKALFWGHPRVEIKAKLSSDYVEHVTRRVWTCGRAGMGGVCGVCGGVELSGPRVNWSREKVAVVRLIPGREGGEDLDGGEVDGVDDVEVGELPAGHDVPLGPEGVRG